MPVVINKGDLKYRTDGGYHTINTVAGVDKKTSEIISEITTTGAAQVSNINSTGSSQVSTINTTGNSQVSAIVSKGAETLASIPKDYTTLSNKVTDLSNRVEKIGWEDIQSFVGSGSAKTKYPTPSYLSDGTILGGTQIDVIWERQDSSTTSTKTSYTMPFNVVYHGSADADPLIGILDDEWDISSSVHASSDGSAVDTENCHTGNAMYMESQFCLPFGDQFDAPEALFTVGSGGLPAGTYYFTVAGNAWCTSDNGKNICFTTTADLTEGMQLRPTQSYDATMVGANMCVYNDGKDTTARYTLVMSKGATGTFLGTMWGTDYDSSLITNNNVKSEADSAGNVHILNHCHRVIFGYNRWSQSGLRQFLNVLTTDGFNWWQSMNIWDRAPSYQNYRCFLYGLSDGLRNVIKPIRRWFHLNNVTDGGGYEYTYDKVFLHVPYERYCSNNDGFNEGSRQRWPWYKSLLDQWNTEQGTSLTQFANWTTYPILKRYRIDAQTSAQYFWSSSSLRSNAHDVWYVLSSGYVYISNALNGICALPAFAITL